MRIAPATIYASTVFVLAFAGAANAQSLSPMRAAVTSMSDQFAIRIYPGNPYEKRVQIKIKVYDHNFREVPAVIRPRDPFVEAGGRRPVTVIIPFEGRYSRKIRICAESTPYLQKQARLKGQVCGRYIGRRAG